MHGDKAKDSSYFAWFPLHANTGALGEMRLGVLARLVSAARRDLGAPHDPQTALSLILRGRSPYDMRPNAATLAPFRLESLSWPGDVCSCPSIESLLPDTALSYLKGYPE